MEDEIESRSLSGALTGKFCRSAQVPFHITPRCDEKPKDLWLSIEITFAGARQNIVDRAVASCEIQSACRDKPGYFFDCSTP